MLPPLDLMSLALVVWIYNSGSVLAWSYLAARRVTRRYTRTGTHQLNLAIMLTPLVAAVFVGLILGLWCVWQEWVWNTISGSDGSVLTFAAVLQMVFMLLWSLRLLGAGLCGPNGPLATSSS